MTDAERIAEIKERLALGVEPWVETYMLWLLDEIERLNDLVKILSDPNRSVL